MNASFYGWYFKCQSNLHSLALIPAIHQTHHTQTCSLQLITDTNTWTIPFSASSFHRKKDFISIDTNQFCKHGIHLEITSPELSIKGNLHFGAISPLKYHIMGPFTLVPFMECRHNVWSMQHSVNGIIDINGQTYSFHDDQGYWEGDQGSSFPKNYIWTHCFLPYGSLMLSIADIPIASIHFTGIIGIVLWKGQEYRFATYLGAKVVRIQNKNIKIMQGDLELEVTLWDIAGHPLKAPTKGNMIRTIHENISCYASYRLYKKEQLIFEFNTEHASFEYEYPN